MLMHTLIDQETARGDAAFVFPESTDTSPIVLKERKYFKDFMMNYHDSKI